VLRSWLLLASGPTHLHVLADLKTCIYNDNDVANQSVLVKHETRLNVHGVFDEIFEPKRTKCIGDNAAVDRWVVELVRRSYQPVGTGSPLWCPLQWRSARSPITGPHWFSDVVDNARGQPWSSKTRQYVVAAATLSAG
jgi:hypothetical protein